MRDSDDSLIGLIGIFLARPIAFNVTFNVTFAERAGIYRQLITNLRRH